MPHNRALELWKQWFDWSGDPYEGPDDYGNVYCFFCGNDKYEGHAVNCIYIQAKVLLEELDNDNTAVA